MKVQVKEGQKGFIYNSMRRGDIDGREPDVFNLKTIFESDGKTVKHSIDDQFSEAWMEKIEVKAKPGPKPKAEKKEPEKKESE